jgi:hypothetical protein
VYSQAKIRASSDGIGVGARLAGGQAGIGRLRLGQAGLFVEGQVGAQVGMLAGAVEQVAGHLRARHLTRGQLGGQGRHIQLVKFGHGVAPLIQ